MSDVDTVESLKTILANRGLGVLEQPDLVEALLQDYCPNSKLDVYLLVSSLKEGVPQRLLAARTATHREAVIGQVCEQMQVNLGVQPEKARWTANSWLKVLTPPATEPPKPPQPAPDPVPTPVPAKFLLNDEWRAFIKKRTARWMFNLKWFQKIEDELVERGVPRADATRMLNEYCGKRQTTANALPPQPKQPFSWTGAFKRLGYLLVACACIAVFVFVFRAHPLTLLENTPSFIAEAFHRAMAGDYVGALQIVGGGALAIVVLAMLLGALNNVFDKGR